MSEDPYMSQLAKELQEEDSARLKTAVNFGVTKTPATYAQQLKTAKLTGMPVQALDDSEVQRILEPLSRKSTIPLDTLPETAPRTSAWLSTHPDNAALGWSSVGQLQTAEQQHQELFAAERQRVDEENRRRGVSGLGGLGRSVLQGGANIGALPYDLTSSALAGLEWVGVLSPTARQATKDFLFSDTSPLNAVASNPYKVAHDSAEYWQSTGRATESLLLTDPKTGEQVMNWGAINPFSLYGLENITQTVAQEAIPTVIQFGVAAMFPPAALGEAALHGPKAARLAKTFWRFATSASAGLEVARTVQGQYNNGIKDLEARGYTKEQAEVEAAPGAYLAGAFSFLAGAPMEASVMEGLAERAMRAPGGPGLVKLVQQSLKSAAVTAGKEGLQEVMNGLGEDAAEWMTYNPNKTAKEFAANAVMNFVGGAAMGGLLGGVSGGQMHMRYAKERAFVEGLHAGLSQSELAKVAPDKLQEYVAQLTENGPLQNLTIGADAWTTYHQSIGEDPRAKALELGVDGADYDIATQAGGDLVLPTAAVASKIAGTEHFEPLFNSMAPALGAPTFGEMKAGQANQEGAEALTKLIETQPESEDRDAIRGLIAAQLHEASTALTPTQATSVADLYARFVVALATQTQQTPMAVFEKNRLQIENAVKMKAQEVANEPASSRGYDGAPGAGGVQAEEAGGGVQGVPGRSEQVRDGLLQGQLAPAPAGFEFAAGAKPPARVWHGTTGQGFDTLKAEGLEPNQEGGLPGLNTTAGPHVAEGYAKDKATGEVTGRVFKVSVDPNAKLIDFSTEKSYTPDELAKLGVANVRGPLTGAQLWDMLRHQLGSSEAAVEHLKAYGFDGAYQNHGGEDAWAYWRDASLLRSAPTSMQQAQAEYALQGSRRDDLGFLKLAQSVDGPTGGITEMHQSVAPPFFSALERAIPELNKIAGKDGLVTTEQIEPWLKARQKDGKFKQAELEAVGLMDWLKLQDGKVSVQAVLDFVSQNGVQVQEVLKREYPTDFMWIAEGEHGPRVAENAAAKFGEYQLPGGIGYRELLLTTPGLTPTVKEQSEFFPKTGDQLFHSQHWDEANVLAHVRFNGRLDASGKRVLFIEEIQSDWAQKGKKEGFRAPIDTSKLSLTQFAGGDAFEVRDANGNFLTNVQRHNFAVMHGAFNQKNVEKFIRWQLKDSPHRYDDNANRGKAPAGPFVTDTKAWVGLAVKRMIRYAAENGFERVAFINGEQSADRYDLSKQVSSVTYTNGELRAYNHANEQVVNQAVAKEQLQDYIGKDAAEKLLNSPLKGVDGVFHLSGADLKVGGAGMRAFYDKIVPQVASGVLKKLSGGVVVPVDIPSLAQQPGFDLSPQLIDAVMAGQPLFQGGQRGFLRFGPAGEDGSRTFDLGLLQAENKSTVLHEFGHLYLEMMGDAVLLEKASDSLKADYQKVLDWFGVTERSQITREMHEQFADAHLQYLLEGKAPSPELVSPFRRFSKWLTKIGNQLLGVDVPMTDEIRGVFDRLYASDAEIEATKQVLGPEILTTPEQAGLSQAEFELLQRHRADAIAEAKERVLHRMMKEQGRERKQEWREEREGYKQQALQELGQRQDYKARKALETGQLEDGTSIAGLDSENAAMFLGYETGAQLDEALKGLEPIDKAANRFARQQMAALHGDLLLDDVARRKAAVEALTGDKQGDLIAAELKVLRKLATKEKPFVKLGATEQRALNDAEKAQAKEDAKAAKAEDRAAQREAAVTPKLSAFRAIAAAHIAHTPLFRVQPNVYLNAMRKHARTAYNAALRNDYAAAAQAHERQLMNHYLHIEAQRALDYQDQFRAWVKRNDSATVRGNIGRAGGTFLAQFDALRDRFGIERVTTTALDRKETLAEWAAGLEAQHEDTLISPQLADESFTKNYRELTLAEMQELHDALKNIKHLAYRETHMLIDGTRIDRKQALEEIVAAMAKNARAKARPELGADRVARKAYKHKATALLEGADSSFVKVQLLANWIDNYDVNGPFHKYIWNRVSQAQTLSYDLQLKLHDRLLRVLEKMPKEHRHSLQEEVEVPGFGTRTRAAILTMLLYNGQETRQFKLLDGYTQPNAQGEYLTEGAMKDAFTNLNASDVAMANEIWAVFDELRPQIQDLEQRLTGVRPEWEGARSFDIHDKQGNVIGHLNGGYFPLIADPHLTGELGKKQEGGPVSQLFGNGYARASTSKGHTKELTGATYPLLLDYTRALTANLANQIHDLAFREAVLDINRIFKNSQFTAAAKAHLGEAYEDKLMPWLVNIANNGNAGASEGMSFWNRVAIAARGNTAAAVIGFKYSSGIVQVMDVERLFRPGPGRVSPRHFSGAMMDFIAHPKATIKMVRELSGEMRHRPEHIDRDMAANLKRLQGDQSLLATWNRKGYVFLAGMDALVSIPAWLGSFRQALASGADEASAIKVADNTVTSRLMTGHAKDLPALMASKNHWWKLATMFMGDATNNYNMLRDAGHRIDGFKGVPTFTLSALMMMGAGVLADLVKGLGPDDDEDPGAWAMRKALLQPFQTMPIVRDGANALENVIAGKPFKDYRFSPALAILQKQIDLVPAAMRFSDGTDDWVDFAIHAGEAVGYFFGIAGTAQAAASTKYLKRYAEGGEEPAAPPVVAYNTLRGKKRSR